MRVVLIGVGHWHASMHADASLVAGARIATAWDPSGELAEAFAAKYSCPVASSLEEAIAGADFAIVMGRPSEIVERSLAIISAGVPVLVEKPIGICAAAVDPLIDAAERRRVFAAVALPHGIGMMAAMRDLDATGRLGQLSHSHFRLINGPPQRYVNDGVAWVLDREVGGGGALRNLGIHGINAFLQLAGHQDVEIVRAAFGRPIHGTNVEDYAVIVLRAADGALGLVEAGYTFASMVRGNYEWRVSSANATVCDLGDRLALSTLDDERQCDLPMTPPARRYEDVLRDAFKRLSDGRPPAVSLNDCQRAMAIIDRCYEMEGL